LLIYNACGNNLEDIVFPEGFNFDLDDLASALVTTLEPILDQVVEKDRALAFVSAFGHALYLSRTLDHFLGSALNLFGLLMPFFSTFHAQTSNPLHHFTKHLPFASVLANDLQFNELSTALQSLDIPSEEEKTETWRLFYEKLRGILETYRKQWDIARIMSLNDEELKVCAV